MSRRATLLGLFSTSLKIITAAVQTAAKGHPELHPELVKGQAEGHIEEAGWRPIAPFGRLRTGFNTPLHGTQDACPELSRGAWPALLITILRKMG